MIQLADGLGMVALAEGIETEAELAFLQENRCPSGQGFLFARPMIGEEVPGFIERSADLVAGADRPGS